MDFDWDGVDDVFDDIADAIHHPKESKFRAKSTAPRRLKWTPSFIMVVVITLLLTALVTFLFTVFSN